MCDRCRGCVGDCSNCFDGDEYDNGHWDYDDDNWDTKSHSSYDDSRRYYEHKYAHASDNYEDFED